MTELVNGPLLIDRLRKAFRKPRKARLAVAFWGKGAAKRLGIREGDDVKIICNLAHGGTNTDEIARLQKLGLKVRQHSRLHAKIGVVGDLSFVGSSNMSANGLGQEGDETIGWEETNIICSGDPLDVGARFRALWKDAESVTDEDIKKACVAWKRNQKAQARSSIGWTGSSLVDAMRHDLQRLTKARVYIAIHQPATPAEEKLIEKEQKELRRQFDKKLDVYLGWDDLPKDAYLVSLERTAEDGEDGTSYEGLYRRPADIDDKGKGDDSFQVVRNVSDICGLKVGKKDKELLKMAALACLRDHDIPIGEAGCFPVAKFAPFLPKA